MTVMLRCLVYLSLLGIGSFLLGRLVPKAWFRWERFPYRTFAWERQGSIYQAIGIRRWQNRIPDMSRILPSVMPAKAITGRKTSAELERMLQETCVAEWIHALLGLLGFGCLWLWPGWGGVMAALLYLVGNLPFVLVQRYNRPRLRRLLERTKNRKEEVR